MDETIINTPGFYTLSGVLLIISCVPIIILLAQNLRNKLNFVYFLHVISVMMWGLACIIIDCVDSKLLAFRLLLIGKAGVIFISVFFYHSILILTRAPKRTFLYYAYSQAILLIILMLTGKYGPGVKYYFNSFYELKFSTAYLIEFLNWSLIGTIAFLKLLKSYFTEFNDQKTGYLILFLGSIGFLGGASNFFPPLGINIIPYGNFLTPLHILLSTYVVLKFQLFNIKPAIQRSIVYTLLIFLISIIYLFGVILMEKFLSDYFQYQSRIISLVFAFIIGLIFFPLKNRLQSFVDTYFFKEFKEQTLKTNKYLRNEYFESSKMKSVANLASGMAHEIKNPLTAIKTFTEYLPEKKDEPGFIDQFTRTVGREVTRIDELIHQLLDFAKPIPLVKKTTDLHQLINGILELLSNSFLKNKITVIKQLEASHSTLSVDRNQLRQALLNIILNAVEAMGDGGTLTLTTSIGPSAIGHQASAKASSDQQPIADRRLQIAISDTGPGIADTDIPHLFDPFFSKKDEGTGLGLSIAHGIIEEHGGTISVASEVGMGTVFTIVLPLTNQEGYTTQDTGHI